MPDSFHTYTAAPPQGRIASADRAILCVQPNLNNRQFLQEALRAFRLEVVETAFEALRRANQFAFDLCVFDYWLADLNGVALCRDILKSDPHVPIIFYTLADRRHMARALRGGAAAYLQPPISAARLVERIEIEMVRADTWGLSARAAVEQVLEDESRRTSVAGATKPMATRERGIRIRAEHAFVAAGGTRLWFQREWPQLFAAACDRVAPASPGQVSAGAIDHPDPAMSADCGLERVGRYNDARMPGQGASSHA